MHLSVAFKNVVIMSKLAKQQKVNNFLKLARLKFIDNGSITDKYLGRRGLDLNRNRDIIFANNLLNPITSWCDSYDLVFNIYENNFIKATKNVNKEYETKILDKKIRGDDKDNLSNTESVVSDLVKLRKNHINNPSIG